MLHIDYGHFDDTVTQTTIFWDSAQARSVDHAVRILINASPELFDVVDEQGRDRTLEVTGVMRQHSEAIGTAAPI